MNRWAFDPKREQEWAEQRRQGIVRAAVADPDTWAPILALWRTQQRPGIEDLVREIRRAWRIKHEAKT